jgi:hypothetical protein
MGVVEPINATSGNIQKDNEKNEKKELVLEHGNGFLPLPDGKPKVIAPLPLPIDPAPLPEPMPHSPKKYNHEKKHDNILHKKKEK